MGEPAPRCKRCDRADCASMVHDHLDPLIPCEACKREVGHPFVCDGAPVDWHKAVAAERERCAAIVERARRAADDFRAADRMREISGTQQAIEAARRLAGAVEALRHPDEDACDCAVKGIACVHGRAFGRAKLAEGSASSTTCEPALCGGA